MVVILFIQLEINRLYNLNYEEIKIVQGEQNGSL